MDTDDLDINLIEELTDQVIVFNKTNNLKYERLVLCELVEAIAIIGLPKLKLENFVRVIVLEDEEPEEPNPEEQEELERQSRLRTANEERERLSDWINLDLGICIYCGEASQERDHLLPKSWTGKGVRSLVPTVPSCRKCNATLSDFPNPVIKDRCNFIADQMKVDPRYDVLRSGGCGG